MENPLRVRGHSDPLSDDGHFSDDEIADIDEIQFDTRKQHNHRRFKSTGDHGRGQTMKDSAKTTTSRPAKLLPGPQKKRSTQHQETSPESQQDVMAFGLVDSGDGEHKMVSYGQEGVLYKMTAPLDNDRQGDDIGPMGIPRLNTTSDRYALYGPGESGGEREEFAGVDGGR
jgi:hypothetical protein